MTLYYKNDEICTDFKWYYDHGYITARDGNAAYRTPTGYTVTKSGSRKQELDGSDFVEVDINGDPVERGQKPSIETKAHVAALGQSGKNFSVHVHSPNTVALAALFENLIGFAPRSDHLVEVLNTKWPELFRYTKIGYIVPFLPPGSRKLHQSIVGSLGYWDNEMITNPDDPDLTELAEVKKWNNICIMQRHGVLAIGDSMEECMEHIVRLEHVSTILLKIITASGRLDSIL